MVVIESESKFVLYVLPIYHVNIMAKGSPQAYLEGKIRERLNLKLGDLKSHCLSRPFYLLT